jgi:hypothetical protein
MPISIGIGKSETIGLPAEETPRGDWTFAPIAYKNSNEKKFTK